MCQFCTAHGEDHKWYLEMKNCAEELAHYQLSHPRIMSTKGFV